MIKFLTVSLIFLTLACGNTPRGLAENEIAATEADLEAAEQTNSLFYI